MNIEVRKTWGSRALALLLPLTLAAGLAGCARGESEEQQAAPDTATVERRDLSIRAEASGLIEPLRIVEVKSKASGEVTAMHAETGMELPQGTLIAEVDPRDVRNNLAQMQADIALAQARVETTSTQRRRAEDLAKAGVISAQDLENTRLEETNARAQLVKAKTNLELAQEKMGDVTIRAPIAGTVIEKTVEQGQIIASASGNVSGGTTLVKMADLSVVQARALIDEIDIGRIQPGQPAAVTVEAYPGRTFRGTVAKVEPQAVVEQNVTMFPVLVRLENPDRLLKPGMNSEVSIDIADREQVVAVPNEAVVNPREAATAGAALGLDEEQLRSQMAEMRRARNGGGQGQGSGGPGGGPAGAAARDTGSRNRGESGGEAGQGGRRRGGSGSTGGGWSGGRSGRGGAMAAGQGGAVAGAQPGVVFIKGANGPEPKFVLLGLSDLDYTEVLRGIEPGQEVYLISVARLKQQQEQFADRMRERAGGGMFGQQSGGSSGSGQGGQGGGSQGGGSGQGGPRSQ